MKNFVVALYSPYPGAGKTSVANAVCDLGFVRVKFAGPLKAMLRAYLQNIGADSNTIDKMLEGSLKECPSPYFCGKSPRYAMQTIGTEWGRELIGDKIWLNAMGSKIDSYSNPEHQTPVVVDDLRFVNEWDLLNNLSNAVTFFYKIVRPGLEAHHTHSSEGNLDGKKPTRILVNDFSNVDAFSVYASDVILDDINRMTNA